MSSTGSWPAGTVNSAEGSLTGTAWRQGLRVNLLPAATLAFLCGIVLGRSLPLEPQYPLAVVALLLLFYPLCPARGKLLLILAAFLCLGDLRVRVELAPPAARNHIYHLIQGRETVTLAGTVIGLVRRDDDACRFTLRLSGLVRRSGPTRGTVQSASGLVRLSLLHARSEDLAPGRTLMAVATLERIRAPATPGVFDWSLYMRSRRVLVSGWISGPGKIRLLNTGPAGASTGILTLSDRMRQGILTYLDQSCDPVTSGLYRALLIGDRSGLSQRLQDDFTRTGCMHLLAISGLHIGLLSLAVSLGLGRLLRLCRPLLLRTHVPSLTLLLTLPILLFYGMMAGLNIPVTRALVMALLLLVAVLLRRTHDLFVLLAAAALLLLVLQPLRLFSASFQLSFGAMLAIALLFPRLPVFRQEKSTPSDRLLRWIKSALLLSLTALAGTLPALLVHFNRVSLIGPLMNLIIEPLLCFMALPLGMSATFLIPLAPDLAGHLFHLGGIFLHIAVWLLDRAAQIPWAALPSITPTRTEIALYALLVLGILLSRRTAARNFCCLGLAALALHFLLMTGPDRKQPRVCFIDTGQGSATLILFPDGRTTLIDGGGSSGGRFDPGRRIISPFLRKLRLWHLDQIIITHPDADHINGLDFLVRNFSPKQVLINGDRGSPDYQRLLTTARKQGARLLLPEAGAILHRDALCTLTCLGMPGLGGVPSGGNDRSLVSRLDCGPVSVLFPGDIETRAEQILLDAGRPLASRVLLAPHHGSRSSTGPEFLRAVAPELIVVQAGRHRRGFPAPVHRLHWQGQGIDVLVTGQTGTLSLIVGDDEYRVLSGRNQSLLTIVRLDRPTGENSPLPGNDHL